LLVNVRHRLLRFRRSWLSATLLLADGIPALLLPVLLHGKARAEFRTPAKRRHFGNPILIPVRMTGNEFPARTRRRWASRWG